MKRILQTLAPTLALVALLASCQEVVEIDLPNTTPRLVVEALVTDGPGPHTVKLSTSTAYTNWENLPTVTNAVVTLSDDQGFSEQLTLNEHNVYVSQNLVGQPGLTYTLEIQHEEQTYRASEPMVPHPAIDSLNYFFSNGENAFFPEGWYVNYFGVIPEYYRWIVSQNGEQFLEPGDYVVRERGIGSDSLFFVPLPFTFEALDTVQLQVASLSPNVYSYYGQFINVLFNDGGLFSPPPQNPESNIRNITNPQNRVLGFFQVSHTHDAQIIIDPTP